MNTYADNKPESKRNAAANSLTRQQGKNEAAFIENNRGKAIQLADATPPVTTTGPAPIQLMKFAYDPDGKETKTIKQKITKVNEVLEQVVSKFGNAEATVTLRLINTGGMSPAYSSRDITKDKKFTGDVVIKLNQWYAEKASVGEIIGMLTHELGVHGMADFHMGLEATPQGTLQAPTQSPFMDERDTEKISHATDKSAGLAHGPHTMAPIDRSNKKEPREEDHVNVGKGLITQKIKSRADVYLNTFLAAGDAIANNKNIPAKEREQQLRELIESFFFDIARIIATDDGKAFAVFSKTAAIAELMNYYHKEVVTHHSGKHPWLSEKSLQVNATSGGLRKKLLGLLGQLLLSSNPTVKKGRAAVGGGLVAAAGVYGGSAIAASLYGTAAIAAGPALLAGAVVGAGIWGVSKWLGY